MKKILGWALVQRTSQPEFLPRGPWKDLRSRSQAKKSFSWPEVSWPFQKWLLPPSLLNPL